MKWKLHMKESICDTCVVLSIEKIQRNLTDEK